MAETLPKVDLAPFLTVPLALARTAYQLLEGLAAKHAIAEKVSTAKDHKVVTQISSKKEFLLAAVGIALIFHGVHFKNALLCTQVVLAFLYGRLKTGLAAVFSDVQTAREKLQADAAPPAKSEAKTAEAKKAETKKDAEAAKKALGAVDADKLSAVGIEVLASLMACLLVIHGGLVQKLAISNALVNLLIGKVEAVVHFPGHEDIKEWTSLLVRLVLYAIFLPLAVIAGPIAIALDAAAFGATLAVEHGLRAAAAAGRVKDADAILASKQGFLAIAGLTVFGALWQTWALAADSGVAWYFQILYLPMVITEAVLGML